MPFEALQAVLMLGGWVAAFLLGRELQSGFQQWRLRASEQATRRDE